MNDSLQPSNDQDARWQARHDAILESASRLLATEGPSGLTMQHIAEEAGFSVGYLYKHFPGKKELLAAILDQKLGVFFKASSEVTAESAGSPLEALRGRIQVAMDLLHAERHLVPLLMTLAEAYPEKIQRLKEPCPVKTRNSFARPWRRGRSVPMTPFIWPLLTTA